GSGNCFAPAKQGPPRLRIYGSSTSKFGRNLDHRFGDQNRDGIEIAGIDLQTQSLRFQRNGATPAEGIENRRWIPARRFQDLLPCGLQHPLIVNVLPFHQLFDDSKQTLTLLFLGLFSGKPIGMGRRIINQRSKEHGATSGQWAPRPPEVKRRWMSVSD